MLNIISISNVMWCGLPCSLFQRGEYCGVYSHIYKSFSHRQQGINTKIKNKKILILVFHRKFVDFITFAFKVFFSSPIFPCNIWPMIFPFLVVFLYLFPLPLCTLFFSRYFYVRPLHKYFYVPVPVHRSYIMFIFQNLP